VAILSFSSEYLVGKAPSEWLAAKPGAKQLARRVV
jgi:hypothetical protein